MALLEGSAIFSDPISSGWSSGLRGNREAAHVVLGDCLCHQSRGLDVLNEGAEIPGPRRAAFWCASSLLDGGEVTLEETRARQGVLVRHEAWPEPGEGVQLVRNKALERVIGTLHTHQLGVLQA